MNSIIATLALLFCAGVVIYISSVIFWSVIIIAIELINKLIDKLIKK